MIVCGAIRLLIRFQSNNGKQHHRCRGYDMSWFITVFQKNMTDSKESSDFYSIVKLLGNMVHVRLYLTSAQGAETTNKTRELRRLIMVYS